MPSLHAVDYFQVVDNLGCPEGGKLFHYVVKSDNAYKSGLVKNYQHRELSPDQDKRGIFEAQTILN